MCVMCVYSERLHAPKVNMYIVVLVYIVSFVNLHKKLLKLLLQYRFALKLINADQQ